MLVTGKYQLISDAGEVQNFFPDELHARWLKGELVIDETCLGTLQMGRPWLSIATDKASRMIMGFYLSFNTPSAHSVLQCLRRAILPKTEWLVLNNKDPLAKARKPIKELVPELGVRMARIRRLVAEGVIDGHESYSSTGRRFLLIRKEQVDELTHADLSEVDLTTAMEYLGLGKVRMRELLRILFPSAYRPLSEYGFPPWRLSRQDVERYLAIGDGLPILAIPEESQVSLFHVLKYWAWNENEIVDLIEAVRDGEITLEGLLGSAIGLARWIFDTQSLKIWRQRRNPELSNWLSVPQVAKLLGLKQEAAYWLVRNEFIPAEKLRALRGCGARVSRVEFERFKESYVFATEISEALKTTSRKVNALLTEQGIVPASGQGLEKCGKIFYARSEVLMDFLATLNVSLPSADFAAIDPASG